MDKVQFVPNNPYDILPIKVNIPKTTAIVAIIMAQIIVLALRISYGVKSLYSSYGKASLTYSKGIPRIGIILLKATPVPT